MGDRKVIKTRDSAAGNPYEVIHILSDINRMQILRLLSEHGELCARDILSYFPITQPTLSHHMNVLLDNHLVEARKSGRWVFYHLSQSGIQEIINFFEALKSASDKSEVSSAQKITLPAQNRTPGRNMAMRPTAARAGSGLPAKASAAQAKPTAAQSKTSAAQAKPASAQAKPDKPAETQAVRAASEDKDRTSVFLTSKKDKKKDKNADKDKSSKKDKKKKKSKKK